MASIEFINKRIAGKEKEIEKLQKKAERIAKAKATNWEVNPYYYDERDEKYTARDLERAIEALNDYKAQLAEETAKAESRNVTVIIEFLEAWKANVRNYYHELFPKYIEALNAYHEADRADCNKEWATRDREERKAIRARMDKRRKEFRFAWGFMEPYVTYAQNSEGRNEKVFDSEKFEKEIKQEANRKYDDMIDRVMKVTGKITDASGLEIGLKGDLNGFIHGEKGTAKLNTIGAGGYNIQCYHFRTLVHEVK